MHSFKVLVLGVLACLTNLAVAATYTFTGPAYTPVTGTNYTTAMSVSGSFTTAAPLPVNMPLTPIATGAVTPLVTAWSFSDGLQTYTQANSTVWNPLIATPSGAYFSVSTDAAGNVLQASIILLSPQAPHALNQRVGVLQILGATSVGATGLCGQVDALANNLCTQVVPDHMGQAQVAGAWARTQSAAVPVPTVSTPALLLLLTLMLAAAGYLQRRRKG